MDYIEVTGKNVDEALTNALIELGTTSDKVEYEVIDKGNSGFLGMMKKPAVIRARKKADADAEALEETIEAFAPKKEEAAPEKKQETRDEETREYSKPRRSEPRKRYDSNREYEKKDYNRKDYGKKDYEKKDYDRKPYVKKEEPVAAAKSDTEDFSEEKVSKYTTVMPNDEIERRITTFLSDTFKAMGFDVQIKISFDDPECVNVELSGDNMGVLIGKRGQTLDSIQYLTSLVVNKGKDKYVRIKLDTEDYRNRRKETLENLARNIAYKVKRSRRPVALEPMNPYERRIIHSALQNDKFVSTKSEGEEPFRHVVVYLDREKNPYRGRANY
jgi:spoIIIJ-associated protein